MKRLGRTRRLVALILLVFGLSTFFEPFITTDPPAMGSAQWSIFDLARWASRADVNGFGHGPRNRTSWGGWNFWLDFVSIYPLLLLTLASVCFFPSQTLLAATGLVGALVSFNNWQRDGFGNMGPRFMLYGDSGQGHVGCAGLWLLLLTLMILLVFVSQHETLDGREASFSSG